MSELQHIPAHADPPTPVESTLAAHVAELVVSGHLCRCGDRIAAYGPGVAPYSPAGTPRPVGMGLPLREDGKPRGRCQCFRARRRQTPARL